MDRLIIRGGKRLEGSVQIRGAKNAVLPQIAAALLSSAPLEITNVPDVSDVTTMLALLQEFGVATQRDARSVTIDAGKAANASRATTWCGRCAPASWCWGRWWRGSARRGCRCRAAARSARGRSTCT